MVKSDSRDKADGAATKRSKSIYERIEKICSKKSTRVTAAATSAPRPLPRCLPSGPATPVSEAWETLSGPLTKPTVNATPVRKVILRFTPRQDIQSETRPIPLPGSKTNPQKAKSSKASSTSSLKKPVPDHDAGQKLARFDNDFDADAEETLLLAQLTDLRDDFRSDCAAVKEWICKQALAIIGKKGSRTLQSQIAGLVFLHLESVLDCSGYSKAVYSAFQYLCDQPAEMIASSASICNVIHKVTIDEALVVKMASSFYSALSGSKSTCAIARLIGALSANYTEAREHFSLELVASTPADVETGFEGIVLGMILQASLFKTGRITDAASKDLLRPFTEDIYKRAISAPAAASHALVRLVKALPSAIAIPELPVAVIMTKYLGQFAIMFLSSSDVLKLDVPVRLSIVDALSQLAAYLRRHERLGRPGPASLSHLASLEMPLKDKAEIRSAYCSLFGAEDWQDSAVDLPVAHVRLVAGYLAPLTQNLVLIHLRLASDPSLQVRIKALRGLLAILDVNDGFVTRDGFDQFVITKLDDHSVSIRDVALELISKCYSIPQLVDLGMLDAISRRLSDSSTMVRKRAVRMHRDILSSDLPTEMQAQLVAALLKCIGDEEKAVSELAYKALKEQWLVKTMASSQDRQAVVQFVALVVRIIRLLEADSDCLQAFMTSCQEESVLAESLNQLATATVDVLFESLIGSVEASSWDAVKFILNAIDIFVGQEHGYLSTHLRLLFELTKTNEMVSVEFALKLMKLAITGTDKAALMQLTGCQQHMALLVLKGSEPVVRNAVEFLFAYCEQVNHGSGTVTALWDRFAGFLSANKSSTVPDSLTSAVCRGLFSLGCLAKCLTQSAGVCEDSPVQRVLLLFIEYFSNQNDLVSYYALQSIASILPEMPMLAFREDVGSVMARSFSCGRINCALVSLRSFIALIEKKPSPTAVSFNNSMKPSEVSFSASIIQKHVSQIVDTAFGLNSECQLLALKVLSFALVQGLCHPHQVLPTIVALSTSPVGEVYSRASEVVRSAAETHSSFLFANYTCIVKALFRLHSQYTDFSGYRDDVAGFESLMGPIYSEVRSKKAKRSDLVCVLLQEFEEAFTSDSEMYALFVLEIVSMLPMKTAEEVAYVFSKVNDLASAASGICLDSSESHTNPELTRCLWLLLLRGYLASSYSFNVEKCEKALDQDTAGKCGITSRSMEPFKVAAEYSCGSAELIRNVLDEQHWIESSSEPKPRPKPKDAKPASRPRKRRRKFSDESDEEDDDIF